MHVFIIAEAGVNHNGDPARALAMVDAAKAAGADAVKFQTFSAAKLVAPSAEKAEYQKRQTGDGSQLEMLQALEMSEDLHHRLIARCQEVAIEFMSTPFDEDALDFLVSAGMRRIKCPSGELVNFPLLRRMAATGLPLIVSTGMATLDEVVEAVEVVRQARLEAGHREPLEDFLTVLHCTSNYPADPGEANLRALRTIAGAVGVPVGYSDHTIGLAVSTAAVALGATVIEKHFTLDRDLPGPDHQASLSVEELGQLIRQIRDAQVALGSGEKMPTEAELKVRAVARRSVAAARDLSAGSTLTADDLTLLRPASGIAPKHLDEVPGRVLNREVGRGEAITWEHLA